VTSKQRFNALPLAVQNSGEIMTNTNPSEGPQKTPGTGTDVVIIETKSTLWISTSDQVYEGWLEIHGRQA
jgi:hypothetical protein